MASRKALGKGLGAFFPDFEDKESSGKSSGQTDKESSNAYADPKKRVNVVLQVPTENIRANPHQPRKEFNKDRLEELAESISNHGLIQPITVRYIGERKFELISGERRLRAAKLAQMKEIPAYVREADDEQVIAFALVENIQREELNPIEIALGYQRLIEECGYTQGEVAEKVGKNRSTVTNMLRLLNLPPYIQAALRNRQIKMGHARALINIKSAEVQKKLLKKTISQEYSVRQLEKAVRRHRKKQEKPKPDTELSQREKAFYEDASRRLRSKFSTKVNIKKKKKGGEIRFEYYSDEELERLLQIFDSLS